MLAVVGEQFRTINTVYDKLHCLLIIIKSTRGIGIGHSDVSIFFFKFLVGPFGGSLRRFHILCDAQGLRQEGGINSLLELSLHLPKSELIPPSISAPERCRGYRPFCGAPLCNTQ